MGPALGLNADAIMAVDGGLSFAPNADFWVGDGDSSPPSLALPEHFLKLSPDKDISDFKVSLDLLGEAKIIHLWGFLGGRRDHELAIIGECHDFLKSHPQCHLKFYEKGVLAGVFFPEGSGKLDHKGGFSLFTLECSQISLTGDIRYSLPDPVTLTPFSSHGISNISQGSIFYKSQAPLLFLFGEF